jgi:hypothetical protein
MMKRKIVWPEGRKFAFTIFDDTDRATILNVPPVYAMLADYGFRTTKSVWPIKGDKEPLIPGATCEDSPYFEWTKSLNDKGFEIGFHNATFHSSLRHETLRGLEKFRELYEHYPYTAANHASNEDAIYWGNYRLSGMHSLVYSLLKGFREHNRFRGHLRGDKFFWGDACRTRIKYMRNFVFDNINTLSCCPFMPYHDVKRPHVNLWFASSAGGVLQSFVKTISEENQDRLEAEGGACIMYTHFAKGFHDGRNLDQRFVELMKRLSRKDGWFVTTRELLDFLYQEQGRHIMTSSERRWLERQWLYSKTRNRDEDGASR